MRTQDSPSTCESAPLPSHIRQGHRNRRPQTNDVFQKTLRSNFNLPQSANCHSQVYFLVNMTANLTRHPEERRLATVMFADVEGFTALADIMDIEDVSDLIREIWTRVDAIIEKHNGYIDKHIGDAVMAVWGAPIAREDDTEQALNAALDMLAAINEFAGQANDLVSQSIKLRVGINTGPVLAGYVGARGEYTVIGDAVNIASRLETNADPGTIIIGERTRQLVRGLFKLHQLEPLVVKGKPDPLAAYLVEGKLAQPNRVRYHSPNGLETRLVGRSDEFARLNEAFERSRRAATPLLVFVRGEAGLGKSRLMLEFSNRLEVEEKSVSVFSTRGLEQTSLAPYFMWKTLWYARFGCSDNDPPEQTRANFLRGIQSLWGAHVGLDPSIEVAHVLGALIGIDWPNSPFIASFGGDADALTLRAYQLFRELFVRICAAGPAILMLDDLQWAGAASLDLLTHLVTLRQGEPALPLLIVGGVRPGLLRGYKELNRIGQVVNLRPMPVSAEAVAKAFPALDQVNPTTLLTLAQRADGNPYFLEEIVKTLVAAKVDWKDDRKILGTLSGQLPETLHSILQARLDALSTDARTVALLASVIGRTFWVSALVAEAHQATMTGLLDMDRDQVAEKITKGLAELVRTELAFPRVGSLFSGEQEYIFKHSLVRDVAYELVPHKYRRQYHMVVARWLVTHSGSDFLATVADHLERAGAVSDAAKQYQQAAHYALSRGAASDARWMFAHAHDLQAT